MVALPLKATQSAKPIKISLNPWRVDVFLSLIPSGHAGSPSSLRPEQSMGMTFGPLQNTARETITPMKIWTLHPSI